MRKHIYKYTGNVYSCIYGYFIIYFPKLTCSLISIYLFYPYVPLVLLNAQHSQIRVAAAARVRDGDPLG